MQSRKKTFQPLFFLFVLTIFFILFYYFLKYPNLSPALFLFYLSLSLWAIIFLDYPAAKLFIFLSILLGIGRLIFVFAEGINKKIFLALELFLFWIAWQLIKKSQIREEKEKIERGKLKITVSIGLAHYPKDGSTAEEIIRASDQALYFSKEKGRNCLTEYSQLKSGVI